MTDEALDLRCRWCRRRFYVCLPCYHGQVYCCEQCAAEGYRSVQDEARARHQSSEEGKEDHRDRMRELRELQNKPVTDEGIVKLPACGKVVPDFGAAASSSDLPASEVEEHTDVAITCSGDAPLSQPTVRPGPGSANKDRMVRCAFCGTILVLQRTAVQPRAG